ncbi:MAG TPA: LON peptidase substrate-binding domain-containing protein [Acidimicrobiia bacterium]|nr:LON peptidase substrate-binding domain-containing protein [Acidimicrobiia bacterium]
METDVTPMFPLGSVLLPGRVLPLHVFEPRYRSMVEHCLAGDGTFGVVLIERGSEVGGGDVRFSVGTLAHIVQAERVADGRFAVVAVGASRFRVREWLADDPYPRARIDLLDDVVGRAPEDAVEEVRSRLHEVLVLHSRLGAPVDDVDVVLADDPVRASFEAAAVSPIGPLDAQALLEVDDAVARLDMLAAHLRDEIEVLRFRLSDDG